MLKLLDLWKGSHDACLEQQSTGLSGPGSPFLSHNPCFSFKVLENDGLLAVGLSIPLLD